MKTYVWEYLNSTVASLFKNRGGGGIESIQPGTGVNIDDSDPSNPIINVVGDGSSSLQDVTDLGNTTTNDIGFEAGVGIEFIANSARVREGTNNAGLGGNKGVALICSNAYELKWEAGRLYYMEQDGFTIREVTHNFTLIPTENDDVNKGFVTGSKWVLDDGTVFLCIDNSSGNATWVPTLPPCIPLRGTAYTDNGRVTGDIEVDVTAGGQMTLRFRNGDIIGLGAESRGYSGISFFDRTASQTFYAYIRGGDLFFENVDSGKSTGGIINAIMSLQSFKQNFSNGVNVTGQDAVGDGNCVYYDNGKVYFDNGLEATRRGYSKLPSYYFIDSCNYTQVGASAPTENVVYETQVGDGLVTKTIAYNAVGHYQINYNFGLTVQYMPLPQNVKVVATSGHDSLFCNISAQVVQSAETQIRVNVFTRNENGTLTNGILKNAYIDVMFYV
jgi:hypothetical protein